MKRLILSLVIFSLFFLTACVSTPEDDEPEAVADCAELQTIEEKQEEPNCVYSDEYLENKQATVETNQGTFVIAFDSERTPVTVSNFIFLAEQGYYDGVIFHRVIEDFMIQGGDPNGTGTGGPGYTIIDEILAPNENNRATISMANSGPNTGGSQFFINVVDNNYLDPQHTVFGEVIEGMDVVDEISRVETNDQDRPLEDIVIEQITIE